MKKYFLFAAVAGMLASCSSESLTGSDPNIEPTQEERVPIQLSVASPSVRATTRGTGTVGGYYGGSSLGIWSEVKGVYDLTQKLAIPKGNYRAIYNISNKPPLTEPFEGVVV